MKNSLISPSNFSSNGNATFFQVENGYSDSLSLLNSERAVLELVQQPLIDGIDDHLIEFSEAMRTVAKVLRHAAEGKASAQVEATEWKRKYELERERNWQLEQKVFNGNHNSEHSDGRFKHLIHQPVQSDGTVDKSERCCGENGICSHEVLRNGEPGYDTNVLPDKMMRKASFKLSWCSKGEKSNQHKHDIVSFEKGNITTAERSSKQISLKWESPPQTVLILTKPNSAAVQLLCLEMVRWLKEQKNLNVFVEPRVRADLLSEFSYYSFVQTWEDGKVWGL
ncbi:unnamed protein product [Cuscuta campestris]|uniref:Uncharacterized protein n=1 Tax=Cuscuta campestris TaxID=132261 RepID=A0A484KDM3_9ASTE|nr:unnamed protein product [Cuscuta campestris]